MRLHLLWISTLLLLPTLCFPVATAQDSGYKLEILGGVDTSNFPEVSVRVRILNSKGDPAKELPSEDIIVFEDGKEVERIRPKVLKEMPGSVMLVMDTSGSMARADKLSEAKRAGQLFLQKLDPKTDCGVILFHDRPYFQSGADDNRTKLQQILEVVESRGGTACYDAVDQALLQLANEVGPRRKAVVVLTDGRDVNSKKKLEEVIRRAKQLEVPVHCVGLGEPGKNHFVRSVLVLDQSGSMGQQRKMQNLKIAAKRFIDLIPENSGESTIVAFNSVATLPGPFTTDKAKLTEVVSRLEPFGETAIYEGTWRALEAFQSTGNTLPDKELRRAIVLLTDGLDNRSRPRRFEQVIQEAKESGIPVYVMGLGEGKELDERGLSLLAEETKGEYFPVRRAEELSAVFEELSIRLHDDGIDEPALRKLAASTGGQYLHVTDSNKLQAAFSEMASTVDNTHTIRFRSQRARPDGTARGIDIRLGDLATTQTAYSTHGLLTPSKHTGTYFLALSALALLLLLPRFTKSWINQPRLEPQK